MKRPVNIPTLEVDQISDFVTEFGTPHLPDYLAVRTRGLRHDKDGSLGYRDLGTIDRYASTSYPSGITIVSGQTIFNKTNGLEYQLLIGVDASGNTRIFIDDGSGGAFSELTTKYTATIDSIDDSARTITLSGVKDILGATHSLTGEDMSSWIVYHPVSGMVSISIDNGGLGYREDDILLVGGGSAGYVTVTSVDGSGVVLTVSISSPGDGYSEGVQTTSVFPLGSSPGSGCKINITSVMKSYGLVISSSDTTLTILNKPTTALGWDVGQSVTLYRSLGLVDFNYQNSVKPHLRYITEEEQEKISVLYGDMTSGALVPKEPIKIKKSDFVIKTTNYDVGRTGIEKWGLIPDFESVGTLSVPKKSTDTVSPISTVIGEGIRFDFSITDKSDDNITSRTYLRLYITVVYNGYLESDPIYQAFVAGVESTQAHVPAQWTAYFPEIVGKVYLDIAQMNKNITAINFYVAHKNAKELGGLTIDELAWNFTPTTTQLKGTLTDWVENSSDYRLAYTLPLTDTSWTLDSSQQYSYSSTGFDFTLTKYLDFISENYIDLKTAIGHVPNPTRSYRTPRFFARTSRSQNAILVIDNGERELDVSVYDGYGVHQDENFPFASVDVNNNPLLINLSGDGTILGMADINQNAVIIRQSEKEVVDIIQGITRISECDCVSKDSITQIGIENSSLGLSWAGCSGLWLMPSNGGSDILINPRWKNFYDGTLLTSDGHTPYVSDVDRENIIMGYEKTFNEVYALIRCRNELNTGYEYLTFRYNLSKDRTNVRLFNTQYPVAMFSNRRDGTLSVIHAGGILKYPNLERDKLCYEDNVKVDGTSNGLGIPTLLRINFGGLYSLRTLASIYDIILDYDADADSDAKLIVNFYMNGNQHPFETKNFNLGETSVPRPLPPVGAVRSLEIEMFFDNTKLTKYRSFELLKTSLGYLSSKRIGNN